MVVRHAGGRSEQTPPGVSAPDSRAAVAIMGQCVKAPARRSCPSHCADKRRDAIGERETAAPARYPRSGPRTWRRWRVRRLKRRMAVPVGEYPWGRVLKVMAILLVRLRGELSGSGGDHPAAVSDLTPRSHAVSASGLDHKWVPRFRSRASLAGWPEAERLDVNGIRRRPPRPAGWQDPPNVDTAGRRSKRPQCDRYLNDPTQEVGSGGYFRLQPHR